MSNLQQAAAALANPPSFVDLREFAQNRDQGIRPATSRGADCFLSSRRILDWAPGPVTAGVIALEAGSGSVSFLPADEFIIVNEGSLTLTQPGFNLELAAGQSAVIQQGAAFTWTAQGPVSLIFTRYNHSQPGTQYRISSSSGGSQPPKNSTALSVHISSTLAYSPSQ